MYEHTPLRNTLVFHAPVERLETPKIIDNLIITMSSFILQADEI